ncbi:MAG: O-antigen ligase family protein [Bacteroidota bacterium]
MNSERSTFFSISAKVNFYTALLLVFAMPLVPHALPIIISLWILTFLLEGGFREKLVKWRNQPFVFALPLLYVVYFVSVSYSTFRSVAMFDMEVKLSLFLIPPLLAASNKHYVNSRIKFMWTFIAANLLASLICLVRGVLNTYSSTTPKDVPSGYYMTYEPLSFLVHTSYFSMYLVLAIMFIVYLLRKESLNAASKVFLIISGSIFIGMIYQVSARSGILSIILVSFIYILFYVRLRKFNSLVKIGFVVFAVALLLLIFKYNVRFKSFFIDRNNAPISNTNSIAGNNMRLLIWQVSMGIIGDNVVGGVGNGDIHSELNKGYSKLGLTQAADLNLNVHNQFIETFLGVGIFGFILLLMVFFYPAIVAWRRKDSLLMLFLILTSFNFMFESMLSTQAGIVFFCWFYAYLLFVKHDRESQPAFDKKQ